jgi:hypothetical protein
VGDLVETNYTPISTIINQLRRLGHTPDLSGIDTESLGLKPDIMNLTKLHLYEIKPIAGLAQAKAEALLYVGILENAGITVALGPTSEPGTSGAIPAPAGVYIFSSLSPGTITYQYRRARLVPVPVPEPSTKRSFRWELRPLTQQELQALGLTAVTITLAVILYYILIGALAF